MCMYVSDINNTELVYSNKIQKCIQLTYHPYSVKKGATDYILNTQLAPFPKQAICNHTVMAYTRCSSTHNPVSNWCGAQASAQELGTSKAVQGMSSTIQRAALFETCHTVCTFIRLQ
jgi:hypothetical protein